MSHGVEVPAGEPLVIVFGYHDGILPNPFFRAYKRVKRAMRRAAFHASVELQPLTRLPTHVDLLITTPPGGAPDSGSSAIKEVISADPDEVQAEIDWAIERLVADGRLTHAPLPARAIAVHHGFRAVTERARLAE